ncbi:helix-hairpin-helix domain-containing protein [Candidatus Chloroploca sp. M-50]|uniref:Helix-hairpin-helix domain-containing protein n=1 Tax=Candidatus Chloroploca mongolica TaxID=2528176 RepID=A0ABS4DBT0_9CHLR|nr:helix-hairpin-helix domain-containing protein [Candidatus Chloroploca mongolica]MBP1466903.1 helix-hairpin-helix domain-containing protein [Candidatus Chloroploca mongolica]
MMLRRLFWLSTLAGAGYLAWRWLRQQNEPVSPAPYTPSARPAAAPATSGPSSANPAASSGPRRIPTRVHRGAPPSTPLPGAQAPAPVSAEAVADTVADTADAIADAVADTAETVADTADAVADTVADTADAVADTVADTADAIAETVADTADAVAETVADEQESVEEDVEEAEEVDDEAEGTRELVNLNTANEKTLAALPGISPSLAKRIIAYRQERGPFSTVEELNGIAGVGPRNFDKFRHLLTV